MLILEWCEREGLRRIQRELVLQPFLRGWAVPYLETRAAYERYLRRSGYEILAVEDLNDRVARNWELAYEHALRAVSELSMTDVPRLVWRGLRLGRAGTRLIKEQFPAALHLKAGFDAGFLRYVYFLVEAR